MLTALIRSQARLAFLGVTRRHDQRRYGAEDKARMSLITPHVRRAVTIADLIDHKSMERDDVVATLDALATAVLILGGEGRLAHANPAGHALLARGTVPTSRGGAIEPWDRTQAAALRSMVETAGASTVVPTCRGEGQAIVSALPLCSGGRKTPAQGRARLALSVQDGACSPDVIEALGRAYQLTGAELRVFLGLAEGATPKGIAVRYGIAASTVRTHLKSLYAKTQTCRRKDVVALLFAMPPVHGRAS